MSEEPEWGLLDLLDPIQLGFLHESLIKNASNAGMNSKRAKDYIEWAEWVKEGIDANCGWEDYEKTQQAYCRKIADYDGRMGWSEPS